jgi:hypothetical protein
MTSGSREQPGMPGSRLRVWAERCFDRQTLELNVLPALADLQHECRDERASPLTRARAYAGVLKVFALCALGQAAIEVRPTLGLIGRRMAITLPLVMITVGGAGIPWLVTIGRKLNTVTALEASALLLPGILVGAIPLAYFLAAVLSGRIGTGPDRLRFSPGVMAGAFACAAVVLVLMAITPSTNQAFRVTVWEAYAAADSRFVGGNPPAKGLTEMGWQELAEVVSNPPGVRQGHLARFHLHQRVAWTLGVFPLALLAISCSNRWRSRRATLAAGAVGFFVYLGAFYSGAMIALYPEGPILGAWAPLMAVSVLALVMFCVPTRVRLKPDASPAA